MKKNESFLKIFQNQQIMHINFNTSNAHKQAELTEFLNSLGWTVSFTGVDLQEPLADADTVIAFKVSQLPMRTLAEDSALFIEGCDQAGVSIRWFMDSLDTDTSLIGRQAVFQVRVALMDDTQFGQKVMIWTGEVPGTIQPSMGNSKFGFDNVFVPDGNPKGFVPYSISKPKELNPRYRALASMVNGEQPKIVNPIYEWTGEWQHE